MNIPAQFSFYLRILFFTLFTSLTGLEKQPWFGEVYAFHLLTGYSYSHFSQIQGNSSSLPPSNDHLVFADLEFSFSPVWSTDIDMEWADTPRQIFGFRSFGSQVRYLWMDDVIGDPFSLSTGVSMRIVSPTSLKDISCPYHGDIEVEGSGALGKEFDSLQFWRFRVWFYAALGIANKGSPWVKGSIALEGNQQDEHKWAIWLEGVHGYGKEGSLNLSSFRGYGRVRQKALDIGIRYGYRMGVWGTLRAEYGKRVLAKRCPKNIHTFTLSYLLPFSF